MKAKYEFLEHSADVKIKATANNFPFALKQIFYGLREFLTSKKRPEISKTKKKSFVLKEKAECLEELVFKFFSSLLTECEIRQMVPIEIKILNYKLKSPMIKTKIFCTDKIKQVDHIKAITYHELKVENQKNKTIITVIFDV